MTTDFIGFDETEKQRNQSNYASKDFSGLRSSAVGLTRNRSKLSRQIRMINPILLPRFLRRPNPWQLPLTPKSVDTQPWLENQ